MSETATPYEVKTDKQRDIIVIHPRHYAQTGLTYLKEAVLRVLLRESDLRPYQISHRLDIPKAQKDDYYPIIHGVLDMLETEKRVQSDGHPSTPRWNLTAAERNLLELIV